MLHRPWQVTKPDVDELHILLRDETKDFLGTAKHQCPLSGVFAVLILGAALLEGFADARTGVLARGDHHVGVKPAGVSLGPPTAAPASWAKMMQVERSVKSALRRQLLRADRPHVPG